jgi:hypothetical protein
MPALGLITSHLAGRWFERGAGDQIFGARGSAETVRDRAGQRGHRFVPQEFGEKNEFAGLIRIAGALRRGGGLELGLHEAELATGERHGACRFVTKCDASAACALRQRG